MKSFISFALVINLMFIFSFAQAGEKEVNPHTILSKEFEELREFALKQKPDYVIGGLMKAKEFGAVTLLWILGDDRENEVIRIFKEEPRNDGQHFAISYYYSQIIVRGTTVLRRFVGPDRTGWRNDTVDVHSGEYFGSQGNRNPFMNEEEKQILREWEITLF